MPSSDLPCAYRYMHVHIQPIKKCSRNNMPSQGFFMLPSNLTYCFPISGIELLADNISAYPVLRYLDLFCMS